MATRIIANANEEGAPKLTIEFNNGDLRALNEIVEKWKFLDAPSALRFALAVLSEAGPDGLCMKDNGVGTVPVRPDAALLAQK